MQQCPTCGSMNPDGAEVCADCGMELPKTGAATPAPGSAASTPTPEANTPTPMPAPGDLAPAPELGASTSFDFAPDSGTSAGASATPEATPAPDAAPSAPAATDPFGGEQWDFNLDKGAEAAPDAAPAEAAPSMEAAPTPDSSSAPTQVVEPSVVPPATSGAAPASSGTGTAKLILKRGGAPTGDVFAIGASATVGRFDPESGPVDVDMANLPESVYISRHHAELNLRDGQWMVKDLGSRNGTFVKNAAGFTRVTGETAVVSGDEVAFGNARFEFQTG